MLSCKHKSIIHYKRDSYRVVIDFPKNCTQIFPFGKLGGGGVNHRSSSNDQDDTKVFSLCSGF